MLKKKQTRAQIIKKYNRALEESIALAVKNAECEKRASRFEDLLDDIAQAVDTAPDSDLKTKISSMIDKALIEPEKEETVLVIPKEKLDAFNDVASD